MSSLTRIAAPPAHRSLSGLFSCASLPSLLCLAPQLIGHKLCAGRSVWYATTDHAPSRQLVGIDRDPLDLDALGRRSPLGPLRLCQPLRIAVVHRKRREGERICEAADGASLSSALLTAGPAERVGETLGPGSTS